MLRRTTTRAQNILVGTVILLVVYRLCKHDEPRIDDAFLDEVKKSRPTLMSLVASDKGGVASDMGYESPETARQGQATSRLSDQYMYKLTTTVAEHEQALARKSRPRQAYAKRFSHWQDAKPGGWISLPLKTLANGSLVHSGLTEWEASRAVVYNRIPRTGSRFTLSLVRTLAKINSFYMIYSVVSNKSSIFNERQNFSKAVGRIRTPFLLARIMYFHDFIEFNMAQPMYISVIRDPVTLLASSFNYYRFGDGTHNTLDRKLKADRNLTLDECIKGNKPECTVEGASVTIRYFCGQDPRCKDPSDWSLERAMANTKHYYLAVGLLEDLETSVQVFEKLLPEFFKGFHDLYVELHSQSKTATNYKYKPSAQAVEIMQKRLYNEYRFYNFIKDRFNALKGRLNL